jgi:hypothetical protein
LPQPQPQPHGVVSNCTPSAERETHLLT